jgi:hypothetical protein
MLTIVYAPGCYGTFLAKCFYYLTNLSGNEKLSVIDAFNFDKDGSSHDFRKNQNAKGKIAYKHASELTAANTQLLSILPCRDHQLDYFDNQFCKQEKKQIVSYSHILFSKDQIEQKLIDGWNYREPLSQNTPRWILREWFSFWLKDCLDRSYDINVYQQLPAKFYTSTLEIFTDLYGILKRGCTQYELTINASMSQVQEIQRQFVKSQTLHNVQKLCDQWVNNIIELQDQASPCLTIFDESWVQHQLRVRGYEIQCDGLDFFPSDSISMAKKIYRKIQ